MKTIPSEMRVGSVPPGMKNGFLVDDELNFGIIADGKLYSIKLSPAEATRMALAGLCRAASCERRPVIRAAGRGSMTVLLHAWPEAMTAEVAAATSAWTSAGCLRHPFSLGDPRAGVGAISTRGWTALRRDMRNGTRGPNRRHDKAPLPSHLRSARTAFLLLPPKRTAGAHPGRSRISRLAGGIPAHSCEL